MKIVIGGKPGAGKSTVAKQLAKELKIKHYSTGDFMRELADERGITLLELGQKAVTDSTIDEELDRKQKKLSESDQSFVIDSRLGAFFIKNAFKVFLDCGDDERARRIFAQNREKEKNNSLEITKHNMKSREENENKRYHKYYGFNCYHKQNFDIVIDTGNVTAEEVVNQIICSLPTKAL